MSSVTEFSTHIRERSTIKVVSTFEPYRQRRTRSFFTRCFGLAEIFVEYDGVISAWTLDSGPEWFTVWLGRLSITCSGVYEFQEGYDGNLRARDRWDDDGGDGP